MSWIPGTEVSIDDKGTKLVAQAAKTFDGDAGYVCVQIYDESGVDLILPNHGHIHIRSEADRRALAATLLAGIEDDRIARALDLLEEHRQVGGRLETECMCTACQMGRALRGEELRT